MNIGEHVANHLEGAVKQFPPVIQKTFDEPLPADHRAARLAAIAERMRSENSEELAIELALDVWKDLSDRHFRISYAIFWNMRS